MKVRYFQNKDNNELKIVVSFDRDVRIREFYLVRKKDDKSMMPIEKPNLYIGSEIYSYFVLPENFLSDDYYLDLSVNGEFIKLEFE